MINSPLQNGGRGEEERGGEEEGAVSEQQTTNGTLQKGNFDHFASPHTQKRPIKSCLTCSQASFNTAPADCLSPKASTVFNTAKFFSASICLIYVLSATIKLSENLQRRDSLAGCI